MNRLHNSSLWALVVAGIVIGLLAGAVFRYAFNDGLDARTAVVIGQTRYSQAQWDKQLDVEREVAGGELSDSQLLANLLIDRVYDKAADEVDLNQQAHEKWVVHDLYWRCCQFRASEWDDVVESGRVVEKELAGRARGAVRQMVEDTIARQRLEDVEVSEDEIAEQVAQIEQIFDQAPAMVIANFTSEADAQAAIDSAPTDEDAFAGAMRARGARVIEDIGLVNINGLTENEKELIDEARFGKVAAKPLQSLMGGYSAILVLQPTAQQLRAHEADVREQAEAAARNAKYDDMREQVRQELLERARDDMRSAFNVSKNVSSDDLEQAQLASRPQ